MWSGSGFSWAPPPLAGVLGYVCLCARSACTLPLLAGVCSVGVCAWARVSAAPHHSWLGCWGLCVFVCALCLYLVNPGWDAQCGCVCLGSAFGCAPALLAGVLGSVCVCVRAPLVPHHSWLGCVVWVCVCLSSGFGCALPLLAGVLGSVCVCVCAPLVPRRFSLGRAVWVCVLVLGLLLRFATPGWGVGVCVCLFAGSACTPPLLAWMCGVGMRAWIRLSAVPRHSWLECWRVGVFLCVLRLYPATRGWGARCVCVCLGLAFGCALPLLAGVLASVGDCVRAPAVPRHSWPGCAPWVCVLPLGLSAAPHHSWLGCWGLCVLMYPLRLYPATSDWGVRGACVCLGSGSGCAPPLLAGVLGCVCRCARSACTPPFLAVVCGVWVGCCLAPVSVPWFVVGCARCPGLRHLVAVVAWHLSVCLGCGRQRASLACLVAPRWCAAPRPVQLLSVLWTGFLMQWCLSPSLALCPGIYGAAARGTWRLDHNRAFCACRWPLPRQ